MTTPGQLSNDNKLLAGIGHVCLQWALIEQCLLAIIGAAEHMPLEKTYSRYGTTDMIPRLRLTFRLALEAGWPVHLTNRIKAMLTAIQKEGGGLAERRNLFVHGVHGPMNAQGEVELTMARWPSNKRTQSVTALDAGALAVRLHEMAQEAQSIFDDYGRWQFGTEGHAKRNQQVAQAKALSRGIRAKNLKRGIKLILANLKP